MTRTYACIVLLLHLEDVIYKYCIQYHIMCNPIIIFIRVKKHPKILTLNMEIKNLKYTTIQWMQIKLNKS